MGKSEHERVTNDRFLTPQAVWEPVVTTLGPIGLDPCSHPHATVPAARRVLLPEYHWADPWLRFQQEQVEYGDGLTRSWAGAGLVFCNPPYSRLARDAWLRKAGEADEIVYLLPVRTSAGWWQDQVAIAPAITFWRGRIVHAGEVHGAPFHQALVYFGPRRDQWVAGMGQHGWTVLGGGQCG